MIRPELPLKIISLMSPFLSRVEGVSHSLPGDWNGQDIANINQAILYQSDNVIYGSTQQRDWLLEQLPTYSLDNIDEVMSLSKTRSFLEPDKVKWLPLNHQLNLPPKYLLIEVFDYLSKRYLQWDGGKVVIKRQYMLEIHALARRMPLAFMVQHYYARTVACGDKRLAHVSTLMESMNLLSLNATSTKSVIRRGLSEGHLHLNAIHATENNWADYLLMPIKDKPKGFSQSDWRLLQFARACARTLALAVILVRAKVEIKANQSKAIHDTLDNLYSAKDNQTSIFLHDKFEEEFDEILTNFKQQPAETLESADFLFSDTANQFSFDDKFLGLFYWLDPMRRAHWQTFYQSNHYPPLKSANECRRYVSKLHIAAHLALIHSPVGESLTASGQQSSDYTTRLFLHRSMYRYLIAQTHHWQLAVQQGRIVGLRQFRRYFGSNQRRPIKADSQQNALAVFKQISHWKGLKVLEGRIAPPQSIDDDIMPWIQAYAKTLDNEGNLSKFGLVIHFIKSLSKFSKIKTDMPNSARYHYQRTLYQQQAFHLYHILQQCNEANPFIVGIDAASLELMTPPEVFAPIFRFLRDAPIEVRTPEQFDNFAGDNKQLYRAIKQLVKSRRLGMTYHVGEEFRHLLSGLRAIDEVITYLNPQPGDRLGHALALGLSPQVWLKHTGSQVLVPKQEWLDTLVWLHHYLGSGHKLITKLHIENEIESLSRAIYGKKNDHITPLQLWNVWLLRQLNPKSIDNAQCEFQPLDDCSEESWRWNRIQKMVVNSVKQEVGKNPPYKLLEQYWYDGNTRKEGAQLHLVDMEDNAKHWIKLCLKMQHLMQKKVIKQQMIIETNPSSNVAIGAMSCLEEHPIFNMAFDKNGQWQKRLKMTINTDNPGTANTSLAHEYYLLAEVMLKMGHPEAQVTQWLEWLRQVGNESSFVRHLPPPDSSNMKLVLDRIIAKAPKGPTDKSNVLLNQWIKGLGKSHDDNSDLIQTLLSTTDRHLKADLLQSIIDQAVSAVNTKT